MSWLSFVISRQIAVRAVGSGRGALKFTLYMDKSCQRKVSRYLSIGYIYIKSQLSKPAGLFVNDAAYKSQPVRVKPGGGRKPVPVLTKISGKGHSNKPVKSNSMPVISRHTNTGGDGALSPLETGMFVLMGVLGVVASVFITNCLIYTYRQQKRKSLNGLRTVSADGTEKVDNGWVWLNKNTLEENAISTSPEQFLSERDFQKRCSRSDSLQSTRSKRSSTGTYKGSECSIRITVNPRNTINLPDLSDSSEGEDELFSASVHKQLVIGIEEPELSDIGDECDEDFSLNSLRSKRRQSAQSDNSEECQQSFIIHDVDEEEKVVLEETASRPASLTQEQFDNLRETVA